MATVTTNPVPAINDTGRTSWPGTREKRNRTPEYRAFIAAKQRCTNPRHKLYPWYGARGIKFLFASFPQFFAELGPRPSTTLSVDRVDNNRHYEPGNLRWATRKEQQNNRRTSRRNQ